MHEGRGRLIPAFQRKFIVGLKEFIGPSKQLMSSLRSGHLVVRFQLSAPAPSVDTVGVDEGIGEALVDAPCDPVEDLWLHIPLLNLKTFKADFVRLDRADHKVPADCVVVQSRFFGRRLASMTLWEAWKMFNLNRRVSASMFAIQFRNTPVLHVVPKLLAVKFVEHCCSNLIWQGAVKEREALAKPRGSHRRGPRQPGRIVRPRSSSESSSWGSLGSGGSQFKRRRRNKSGSGA